MTRESAPKGAFQVPAAKQDHQQDTDRRLPEGYLAVRATLPKTPDIPLRLAAAYPGRDRTGDLAKRIADLVVARLRETA